MFIDIVRIFDPKHFRCICDNNSLCSENLRVAEIEVRVVALRAIAEGSWGTSTLEQILAC